METMTQFVVKVGDSYFAGSTGYVAHWTDDEAEAKKFCRRKDALTVRRNLTKLYPEIKGKRRVLDIDV